MSITHKRFLLPLITALFLPVLVNAQQFVGLNTTDYSAIQHMLTNPAWVANANNGMEIMGFSVSALGGTNAYGVRKDFVFGGFEGKAKEGKSDAYIRNNELGVKHLWGNIKINGPAMSFKYKDEHFLGFFTRARQIYRAGHIASSELNIIGKEYPEEFLRGPVEFKKAGFSTHTFAEIGFTYGRILRNDYYNIVRGGVSVKYLMGFVAGSVYANSLSYTKNDNDSISLQGDLTMLYTHNIGAYVDNNFQNDITSWFQRAGKSGLGLDIGVQYEYHPDGNPNYPTPYTYRVAASITDLGGIGYVADTGSGRYDLNIQNIDSSIDKISYEGVNEYMMRMETDSLTGKGEKAEKFRMGLPTAFRLNADYNVSDRVNFAVNMLLNMRGNGGDVYRPAYVSYINFTPSFGGRNFRVGLPFTLIGYQTFSIGANVRFGPFYIGSSSALGMLMTKKISNIDAYAGLVLKFRKNERRL